MQAHQTSAAGALTGQAALASSYRAELCCPMLDDDGTLIDWLIGYAFDTLGASRLELRVTAPDTCACQVGDAA